MTERLHIPAVVMVNRAFKAKVQQPILIETSQFIVFSDLPEKMLQQSGAGIWNILPYSDGYKLRLQTEDDAITIRNHNYGLHPLYYYAQDDAFACSTNIRQLIQILKDTTTVALHQEALIHYYCFGFEPGEQSMITGIKKLPAGHTLTYSSGKLVIKEHYNLASGFLQNGHTYSEDELVSQIDNLFGEGLQRMASPGVNGISLSGGVDSGYTAVKLRSVQNLRAYTLNYGMAYSENSRIDSLARYLNIRVETLTLKPEEIISNFEQVNSLVSQPCGFNNATMDILFQKAASDGVQTLFDGDGADRLFLGMNRYLQLQRLLSSYHKLENIGLAAIASQILGILPSANFRKAHHLFKNWQRGIPPYVERIYEAKPYNRQFENSIYRNWVATDWDAFREANPKYRVFADPFRFLSYYAIVRCPEMFFHQPSELQLRYGINAAPAFWDTQLVELAVKIPVHFKLRKATTKYILRKAASKNIFPEYWKLPKIGLQSAYRFAVETNQGAEWLRNTTEEINRSGYFDDLTEMLGATIDFRRLLPVYLWYKQL